MNVAKLIAILQTMDPDADVTLGIDRETEDGDWETDLVLLSLDDVVMAETYVAFQVPSEQEFNDYEKGE